MANKPDPVTAVQLDATTPAERYAAFEKRLVPDVDSLPEDLRKRVIETAERLARDRRDTKAG